MALILYQSTDSFLSEFVAPAFPNRRLAFAIEKGDVDVVRAVIHSAMGQSKRGSLFECEHASFYPSFRMYSPGNCNRFRGLCRCGPMRGLRAVDRLRVRTRLVSSSHNDVFFYRQSDDVNNIPDTCSDDHENEMIPEGPIMSPMELAASLGELEIVRLLAMEKRG